MDTENSKIIRYVYLDEVDSFELCAEQELTKHIELESPLLTIIFPKQPTLSMTGDYPVETYLKKDEDFTGINLIRFTSPGDFAGSQFLDKNSVFVHLHIKENDDLPKDICRILKVSVVKILKEYGVFLSESPHVSETNDLIINEGGKFKKIGGTWKQGFREGWKIYGIGINFKPDYETMGRFFRMDTEKMQRKSVTTVEDAITGVGENLNKREVTEKIGRFIAERLGYGFIVSELSQIEQDTIKNQAVILSNKGWINNAKYE